MSRERHDAIVIGGGPAGATAAILLARAGWSVAIIEKATFPRRKVCGEFLSATNAALLDAIGIGDTFGQSAGPEVRRVGLYANEAMLTAEMPQASGRWGRALGRDRLDTVLLEQAGAEGAFVWQPWQATTLDTLPGGYACRIVSEGEEQVLQAPIVIAAHGSWERGPLPTQAARPHRPSDLLAFKAHFSGALLPSDLMPLIAFPGGYGGLVHTDAGRVTLSCCIRRDALEKCRERHPGLPAAQAVFAHISESCLGVRQTLAGATLVDRWLSAGPIAPGIRARFADGIFRIGNTAGEAHPIVAEGISMAMQSAWLLCRNLVAHQNEIGSPHPPAAAGKDYSAAWRSHFAPRIRAASFFANLAMRPASATLLLPFLTRFPAILTLGARLSGKSRELGVPVTATR